LKNNDSGKRNKDCENVNRSTVVYRPVGGFKILDMFFFHGWMLAAELF
jgi:hypothetical protein